MWLSALWLAVQCAPSPAQYLSLKAIPLSADLMPEQAYQRLRPLGDAIWLDSSDHSHNKNSQFDIIVAQPSQRLCLNGDNNAVRIELFLSQHLIASGSPIADLPFQGGAVGYLSYQALNNQLGVLKHENSDINLPEVFIGIYDWAVVFDHRDQHAYLVVQPKTQEKLIQQIQSLLALPVPPPPSFSLNVGWQADSSLGTYQKQLKRIDEYIHAGDCYQVNLSQRFSGNYSGDTFAAYLRLRTANPCPFGAYIDLPEGSIMSLSPERFIQMQSNKVTSQPIKGTRAKRNNPAADQAQIEDLLNSEKDRAENLMIVDLLRNDLGKTSITGSVRCERLFELQSFANVHHLVSTITARSNRSPWQVLSQAFPGGSITGAPKKRAMEIIQELEQVDRSVYCGSVFYISQHGNMDSNIAIRSLVASENTIYCWGGGGIVADSDSDEEYQESLDKIQLLMKTLENAD